MHVVQKLVIKKKCKDKLSAVQTKSHQNKARFKAETFVACFFDGPIQIKKKTRSEKKMNYRTETGSNLSIKKVKFYKRLGVFYKNFFTLG